MNCFREYNIAGETLTAEKQIYSVSLKNFRCLAYLHNLLEYGDENNKKSAPTILMALILMALISQIATLL